MAGAFGGILAWGIGHMRGVAGLSGWRYVTSFTDAWSVNTDQGVDGSLSLREFSPSCLDLPPTGT